MLVFCHEWPEHYGEVLQAVLRSSSSSDSNGGSVSIMVWNDILKTLGYKVQSGQSFTDELRLYATSQNLLKHEEVRF